MLNEHYEGDGAVIYKHVCEFGCEGIVSQKKIGLAVLERASRDPTLEMKFKREVVLPTRTK